MRATPVRLDSLEGMYPFLFRTVLSRMDPETAHHAAMIVIRLLGVPPFSWAARALAAPDQALRTSALGLDFDSPFGVAAGFDKDVTATRGLYALGFGHIEVGTLTAIAQAGNPRPRLFRLIPDRAVVNRMGFNNGGAAAAAERLRKLRRKAKRAVIGVNIGKSRVVDVADATGDYVVSARLLAPLADYLVVNVSSPNTPGLRGLQAIETLRPLLEAVRDAAGQTPLLVKIAPDLSDDEIRAIAGLAVELGLAGLIATNTTISRDGLSTDPSVDRCGRRRRPVRRAAQGARDRGAPDRAVRRPGGVLRDLGRRCGDRRGCPRARRRPVPPSCRATRRSCIAVRSGLARSTAG